jgi:hypothetical protein
MIHDLGPGIV